MTVIIQGSQLRTLELGTKVDQPTAALPQSALGTLFTVAGGRVWVTSIVGVVTTAIQAQANAVKLRATPTTGAVNDLSGTVDINGAAIGALLSATGLAGDALVLSTGGGISTLRNPILVAVGTIGLNTAASNTGSIQWSLTYVPYDDGASVS
jgi:hypothetical protein